MKYTLVIFLLLTISMVAFSQTPQSLNYQAVARNSTGQIIPSQNVGVRFSILDGSVNGSEVYVETHNATTNSFGLFTLGIGSGTVVSGGFSSINWATGNKFLKVEIAPAGGTNYTIQGTTQFLSVPYALYSEKTKLLAGNNTISVTNGNTITGNYQAANNNVLISGNTIAGNYQPANSTVLVNGNTIAGNYQPANNTILMNGNSISGNYQPANNTVLVNGNTIAGNYQPANNTILMNGNSISGNYQPGTGINISGNTISHNLQAGTGISISGNTISATGGTGGGLWIADANGQHSLTGKVGIGTNSQNLSVLSIRQSNTGIGGTGIEVSSDDTWLQE